MEYPGPVGVPAAAVVAFGDTVLIHAQDARTASLPSITQVDYRFRNIDFIEMTSQSVGETVEPIPVLPVMPVLSKWGAMVLMMLLAGSALLRLRQLRSP